MPPVADPALATVIPRGRVSFFHKVEIFLEQREVAFLSPSKIWIQIFANFAGW